MSRANYFALVVWLLSSQLPISLSAQEYRFNNYGRKDGLANDFAASLQQDSLGYIWIHYYGVLSRFDGYGFKTFKYNADDTTRSAIDFMMGRLVKGYNNQIWIPQHKPSNDSIRTLAKYNARTDAFSRYDIHIDLPGEFINKYLFDGPDGVWLGTSGVGLFYHNFKSRTTEKYFNMANDSSYFSRQNGILGFKDLGSEILMGTARGLWIFNKASKTFSRPECDPGDTTLLYQEWTRILDDQDTPHTWIKVNQTLVRVDSNYRIVQTYQLPKGVFVGNYDIDADGIIWFGGLFEAKTGFYRYDPADNSLVNIKHDPGDPKSLSSDIVYAVMIDRDQNVWVGTDNGLSVLRRQSLKFYNTPIKEGTLYAAGLYHSDRSEFLIVSQFLAQSNSFNLNQLMMTRIVPNRPDSVALKPLFKRIDKGLVQGIHQGRKLLWITAWQGAILGYSFDAKSDAFIQDPTITYTGEPGNPNTIRSNEFGWPWEDAAGRVLIITSEGAELINPVVPYGMPGSVKHLESIPAGTMSLHPRDENSIWILNWYDRTVSIFSSDSLRLVGQIKEPPYTMQKRSTGSQLIGAEDALYEIYQKGGQNVIRKLHDFPDTEIDAIQEDNLGRIWLYTNVGLLCYDTANRNTVEFGEDEGILHIRSLYTEWLLKTSTGLMISANPDGVTTFDPSTFKLSHNEVIPVLTRLAINNTSLSGRFLPGDEGFSIPVDISVLRHLVVDYEHNNFRIEFSAMEMTSPDKNLYRHRLEGYDENWIETTFRDRTATYTNLPAGEYTFRVKASNRHRMWSEGERVLYVTILPPPWRTWWAYTGYGLLAVGLLLLARRNIVQRERLAANLNLEHIELEKAKEVDRVKTSFFTNISHEFRTPLTLIKGPVQGMIEQFMNGQAEIDKQKVVGQLKLVQRNSDLLLKLINQLLDLAKLESGSLKVEKTEGDLFSFIRASASSFESFARQKNITLIVEVPSGSHSAFFDKDKLETILINLINNAIKFTPAQGSVAISVHVASSTERLTLVVTDTGIGIPLEHQSKIFDRFHQVSETHKEVGTGIGLSLVKELVTLMEGSITVKSSQGSGSEFTVVLPIETAASYEPRAASAKQELVVDSPGDNGSARGSQLEARSLDGDDLRPQVLVVEDNSDLRAFIIDSLGAEFQFYQAENGKQGLAIATEHIPDMIISDVMMPEMDGLEMTRRIKEDIKTSHIPLILLTAKSGEDSKLEGLSKGADDYLTKPFNKQELLLKVRNGTARMQKLRDKLKVDVLSIAPAIEVQSEDEQFLQKVKETIVERMSDEQLSVESLADDMGMSRVQLYRKVSALTGMAVNELIRKLRLQRAGQLLGQQWGPVSQVAYEVGFSNLSYFSKVFKEEFGVLPSEYEESV